MTKLFEKTIYLKNNKVIVCLSIISIAIGFSYGVSLIYYNLFCGCILTLSQIYLVAVFIATGLLGSVFEFVLKKFIFNYLEEYLSKEKLKEVIEDNIFNILEKQKNIDDNESYINVEIENGEVAIPDTNNEIIDSLIVTASKTIDKIKETNEYVCQSTKTFKDGLNFIAFYTNKRIVGYGKIISNYNEVKNNHKHFKIESFIPLDIEHRLPYAYLRNYKYCTSASLKNAKSTYDIRPNKYEIS